MVLAVRRLGLRLKDRVPMSQRRKLALARVSARQATASLRALPDFLVIGAQRCGTSSLYKYLGAHPNVIPSLRKEVEYFSTGFDRGEGWYRAHFPLRSRMWLSQRVKGIRPRTFEATPDYLLDPRAAPRAVRLLPDAKIVVLLRNPVDRAFSHYHHNLRYNLEPKASFEEALAAEESRLDGEYERIADDPTYQALPLRRHAYVQRGLYAEQLRPWLDAYPDAVTIIPSEGLFGDISGRLSDLCSFLGVPPTSQAEYRNYSYGAQPRPKETMKDDTRRMLAERFHEPNQALFQLLGTDFGWNDTVDRESGV